MERFTRIIFKLFVAAGTVAVVSSTLASAQVIQNPTAAQTQQARAQGPCSDPWVTWALWYVTASQPIKGAGNTGECNIQLYNGGTWSNFDQLVKAVYATRQALAGKVTFSVARVNSNTVRVWTDLGGGFSNWANVSGVIAQGGGNVIAQGGGNVIAQGGGNVIAQGGGNFRVQAVDGNHRNIPLPNNRVLMVTKQ